MIRSILAAAVLLVAVAAPRAEDLPLLPPPVTEGGPPVAGSSVTPGISAAAADDVARRLAWMLATPTVTRPDTMGGLRLLYDSGADAWLDRQVVTLGMAVEAALSAAPAIPHERLAVTGDAVEVTLTGTDTQLGDARARLEALRGALPDGGFEFDLSLSGGFARYTYTDAGVAFRTAELQDATIAAIGRRLAGQDVQATARAQGDDRIVVTLAGPAAEAARTAIETSDDVIAIHLVTRTLLTAVPDPLPAGTIALPDPNDPGTVYLMPEEPIVGFTGFATAAAERDPTTGLPIVVFGLTDEAARTFAAATSANVGRTMAIVVEGRVVSAPVIQTAILGGTGVITGSFTMDGATALAAAIRAGGLPAPVTLVETRTVDEAWPVGSPLANRGAVAVELLAENGRAVLPWEIAASAYWLGLGKSSLQRLDGNDQTAVLTMPIPRGGDEGRATALADLRASLEGLYSIRAVWVLGPLLVLGPDGFVPAP